MEGRWDEGLLHLVHYCMGMVGGEGVVVVGSGSIVVQGNTFKLCLIPTYSNVVCLQPIPLSIYTLDSLLPSCSDMGLLLCPL